MIFRILHHRTAYHEHFVKLYGSNDLMLPTGQKSVKTYMHTTAVNLKTGETYPSEFVAYEFDIPEADARDFIEGWTVFGKCDMMDDIPILIPAYL